MKWFNHVKQKWGIESNWDFFLINVTFACAGMLIVHERRPIFTLLGVTDQTPMWIKVLIYIPFIFPAYQLNLLIFGTILGQFKFFWEKEKKLAKFLFGGFLRRKDI